MPASDRPTARDTAVARRMSAQRRTGTGPEMLVRRLLHARGLRYRVNVPLPGLPRRRADIVFTRPRVVVFIDGCFWHRCPQHATSPLTNSEWWAAKLAGNVTRDRETDTHLDDQGWVVLRFWEHEDPLAVAELIIEEVGRCRTRNSTGSRSGQPPTTASIGGKR